MLNLNKTLSAKTVSRLQNRFSKGVVLFRGIKPKGATPSDPGDLGVGEYYSSSYYRAKEYGTVVEKRIILSNPLILAEEEAYERIADKYNTIIGTLAQRKLGAIKATEDLIKQGFDGLVSVRNDQLEVVIYVGVPQN